MKLPNFPLIYLNNPIKIQRKYPRKKNETTKYTWQHLISITCVMMMMLMIKQM